jgi:S1-C subfamily serine protease
MESVKSIGAHVVTALVTLALVQFWFVARNPARREPSAISNPEPLPIPGDLLKAADADEQINIRVYANTNRSVVNITTAASSIGLFGDESTTGGSGSGFVIDREGHILTNYHVIEGADTVQVTFADGSPLEAKIVGADASNDVAVIRVDLPADRLSPVNLGDSSGLMVGQKVARSGSRPGSASPCRSTRSSASSAP